MGVSAMNHYDAIAAVENAPVWGRDQMSTNTPVIHRKDGTIMDVKRVIRQAQLLEKAQPLTTRRCVPELDKQFIWKILDRWETCGNLSDRHEYLITVLCERNGIKTA